VAAKGCMCGCRSQPVCQVSWLCMPCSTNIFVARLAARPMATCIDEKCTTLQFTAVEGPVPVLFTDPSASAAET
jgi:hypothetical protein